MRHKVPYSDLEFEVPDDWWKSAGMENFVPSSDYYVTKKSFSSHIVAVEEVEPPLRNGEFWFRNRESVIEVLKKMRTGEEQEPIEVWSREKKKSNKFCVKDGFHRFYLSIAVGYRKIPIKVNDFDLNEFLEKERNGNI